MTRTRSFLLFASTWALAGFSAACSPASPPTPVAPVPPTASPPSPSSDASSTKIEIAGPEASPITFDRMSRWPEPGWQVPRSISFSPDGKSITFLQSEKQNDETALFAFDRSSKEVHRLLRADDLSAVKVTLSREEELRRERERSRTKGITSYVWAKNAPLLVVPFGGDVYARRADGTIVRLTETPEPEIDARPCDTGARVAFVKKGELWVVDVATRKPIALTQGAPAGVTRGLSDFNGQEEFDEHHGYFWSPQCDRIAYLEVDERGVGEIPVVGYRNGRADVMMQRYPVAGGKNPAVRVAVVDVATRKTTYLRLPGDGKEEKYFGRFAWAADGRALFLQTVSRDQKRRELVRVETSSLAAKVIAAETSPTWVAFSEILVLEHAPRLLWTTDRSGFRHIQMLDATTGSTISDVTSGNWDVHAIEGVDEDGGRVLFTAGKESPVELQLYAAKLSERSEPVQLSREPGVHEPKVEHAGRSWVDVHSAADRPPQAVVHDAQADGGELPCPLDPDFASLRLRAPEIVTVRGAEGTMLYGSLLRPRNVVPGKRYPVVVMVYGGPGHQTVQNRWGPHLQWQHLADRGIAVFQLDNRGTPSRGRAFESATYRRLGEIELADQLAGLDYLVGLPFVDPDRIGIYGHSYGGFMAALAMLHAPGRFCVGVAGSPVVDWRLYDTGYTERYMGIPADNPTGYAATDLGTMASNLRGKLLILHALMDENVHFQNSAELVDALVAAGKSFDLFVFPGERHGYQAPQAKKYAAERVVDYFAHNL